MNLLFNTYKKFHYLSLQIIIYDHIIIKLNFINFNIFKAK
jgi:hypothetical protein